MYRNPLRSASLSPGRVDQGVDYSGSGTVHALGPGVIEQVWNPGWPGGVFIDELLTAGPDAGRYVYVAEDLNPRVRVGQHVTSSTVLADITGGIETGWAAPPPDTGQALAYVTGQSNYTGDAGAHPTAWGENYNQLLISLGAPAGVLSGRPVGSAPAGPGPASPGPAGAAQAAGSLGLAGLAVVIPIAAAGAAIAIWGAARAAGVDDTLRTAARRAGKTAAIGAMLA